VAPERSIASLTQCGDFVALALAPTKDPELRRALPPAQLHASLAVLRAKDGELDRNLRLSSSFDWQRKPHPLDRSRIVCMPDDSTVACIDLDTGRHHWRRSLEGEAGGGPPDVLTLGGFLVEVQSGRFVSRLNPEDGTRAWREQATLGPPVARVSIPSAQFTLDGRRVYCVAGGAVQAYAMADGRAVWLSEAIVGKPETSWRLVLTVGATPQLLALALGPQPLELVVLDPTEGGRLQRIALAEQADFPRLALYGDELVIASRQAVWRLTAEAAR
jgi:outer membrane protein assembly factor BamB